MCVCVCVCILYLSIYCSEFGVADLSAWRAQTTYVNVIMCYITIGH